MDERTSATSLLVTASLWATALAPAGHLLLFALFVLRARVSLGYWPTPYHPDPKDLGFGFHELLIVLSGPGVFLSPIPFLGALLAHLAVPRRLERIAVAVIFVVAYSAWWTYLRLDPGSFGAWFMD